MQAIAEKQNVGVWTGFNWPKNSKMILVHTVKIIQFLQRREFLWQLSDWELEHHGDRRQVFGASRRIRAVFVGPCHHGMARPQVADGGMASDMEGSCE